MIRSKDTIAPGNDPRSIRDTEHERRVRDGGGQELALLPALSCGGLTAQSWAVSHGKCFTTRAAVRA